MSDRNENKSVDETADPGDARLTDLVAYLDGELEDLDSDRVERELVSDAPLRSYAESLDRTWRLLDSLGESTASGEFAQKTLASLNALPFEEDDGKISNRPNSVVRVLFAAPWMKWSLWCLVGFAGASAGLLASRTLSTPKAESADLQILRQLDLLLDYQKIRPIPDAEFLKSIAGTSESSAKPPGDAP